MRPAQGLLAVLIWIGCISPAYAHGGGPHVLGTVKAVGAKSITVTDATAKPVVVSVDDKTTVERGGKPATLTEVKVGERVVVHTRKTAAGLVAIIIKVGPIAKTAPH
jgi:hypothetical protein